MSIKEYFANYDNLSYEEWCEMLPDILEETTTYKELAQTVKGMYEEMMVPLKRRHAGRREDHHDRIHRSTT